ncbi:MULTISPECIES: hypothetical protein [unclassified Pseudomonas]|uniref:hypothetical protein n=1 Tax=unclassified Pseudomonas TaxID=196821 RepID=UPI000A1E2767|nr:MULTISPECIES: hypothetical protein [unclassified Pseudomonas]
MAKAPASTAADKASKTPRKPRQSTGSAAADQDKETGAQAPVSTPGGQAGAATNTAPVAEQTTPQVSAEGEFRSGTSFGMGRFPDDWKPVQTPEKSGAEQAVQSLAWALPDIAEFPAELTLTNNTRNTLVVRALGVRLRRFGEVTVQCQEAAQYQEIARELATRAMRERWDSDIGLQVKYGEER